jgi:hypothetical protein
LVSIVIDLAWIIHLFFLGIREASVGFCNFLEFSWSFFLLCLIFISISVRVIYES